MTTELKEKVESAIDDLQNFRTKQEEAIKANTDKTGEALAETKKVADAIATVIDAQNQMKARMEQLEALTNRAENSNQKDLVVESEKKLLNDFFRADNEGKLGITVFVNQHKNNKDYAPYLEAKALTISGSPENGGYLVLPEYGQLMNNRIFETSPMRQLASIISIGTDRLVMPFDDDEPDVAHVSETGTRSESNTNTLAQLEIDVHEMYAYPKMSTRALEDTYLDIEKWHEGKVSDRFARYEATDFISGNGVGRAKGILSYSDWTTPETYQRNAIERIPSGSDTTVTAAGFLNTWGNLKEVYAANAIWLMHRLTFASLLGLKYGDGKYLLIPSFENGPMFTILGNPVRFAADMGRISSGQNTIVVSFGDFKRGYQIVDRVGLSVIRDPYTTPGFVKFHTRKRVGGGVVNFEAIKHMDINVS